MKVMGFHTEDEGGGEPLYLAYGRCSATCFVAVGVAVVSDIGFHCPQGTHNCVAFMGQGRVLRQSHCVLPHIHIFPRGDGLYHGNEY